MTGAPVKQKSPKAGILTAFRAFAFLDVMSDVKTGQPRVTIDFFDLGPFSVFRENQGPRSPWMCQVTRRCPRSLVVLTFSESKTT